MDGGLQSGISKIIGVRPELERTISPEQGVQAMHKLHEKISALMEETGTKPSVSEVVAQGDTAVQGLLTAQAAMQEQLGILLEARVSALRSKLYSGLTIIALSLLLVWYAFYSFFVVTRGGLQLISRHLKEVSTGDLRAPPRKPLGSDEAAQVILDLRVAYNSLHELIRKVRHSANALHAAAAEISAASMNLNSRTEAAAAALEQQASAMEEIDSTVQGTAQQAAMAATFAVDKTPT